ncbi:MAG: 50S ribosomal protein L29 [Bacteroidota bacterium]
MKAQEIRDLSLQEVKARLKEEQDVLLRLRLNHAVSSIENPSEIRESRRTIARLKTILKERELAQQKSE